MQTFVGSLLVCISTIILGLSHSATFDGYIAGAILLAIGGNAIFMGLIPLSDFFRPKEAILLTLLSSSFDASTGVFVVYLVSVKKLFTFLRKFSKSIKYHQVPFLNFILYYQ